MFLTQLQSTHVYLTVYCYDYRALENKCLLSTNEMSLLLSFTEQILVVVICVRILETLDNFLKRCDAKKPLRLNWKK